MEGESRRMQSSVESRAPLCYRCESDYNSKMPVAQRINEVTFAGSGFPSDRWIIELTIVLCTLLPIQMLAV